MKKKDKAAIEKAMIEQMIAEVAKRNERNYFVQFTRFHRAWAKELVGHYLASDDLPLLPTHIAEYYDNPLDAEIALMASLAIISKKDDNMLDDILYVRDIIGKHPREWFDSRGFVPLSTGWMQDRTKKLSPRAINRKLSQLFSVIWEDYQRCRDEMDCESLWDVVHWLGTTEQESPMEVVTRWGCGLSKEYNIRLALIVLGTSDGIGRGLWSIPQIELCVPDTSEMRRFWKIWVPKLKLFTYAEVADMMDFGREVDCYYFFLAFKRLKEKDPAGCERYVASFSNRYKVGNTMTWDVANKLRLIAPKII